MARWPNIEISKESVIEALVKNHYLILSTSKELGIGRGVLNRLIKDFNIDLPKRPLGKSLRDMNNPYLSHPKYARAKSTYDGIKKRCYNPKEACYPSYGGRGIVMCASWLENFSNFFEYVVLLDNSFEDGYSIDRINVNGNYEPDNIRFLTAKEQMNNTRVNRITEWEGVKYTLTQFAEKFGLTHDFVKDRLRLGFTLEEVVSLPRYKKRSKDKVSLVSKGTNCIEAWFRLEGVVKKKYFYYSTYKDKTLLAAKEWLLFNSGFSKEDVQEVVRKLEHKLLDKDVPYQLL